MYADEYRRRISTYDQAVHDAQQRARNVPEVIEPPAGLPAEEWAAGWRLSPEHVAVVHAQLNRERAMQAWEREMDAEDEMAKYGINPASRSQTPLPTNVIAVDFANRTRVSRPRQGGRA